VGRKNGRDSKMMMAFWSNCRMARSTLWQWKRPSRVARERQMVASGVVGGDQFFETGHDVVLVLGLGI